MLALRHGGVGDPIRGHKPVQAELRVVGVVSKVTPVEVSPFRPLNPLVNPVPDKAALQALVLAQVPLIVPQS